MLPGPDVDPGPVHSHSDDNSPNVLDLVVRASTVAASPDVSPATWLRSRTLSAGSRR